MGNKQSTKFVAGHKCDQGDHVLRCPRRYLLAEYPDLEVEFWEYLYDIRALRLGVCPMCGRLAPDTCTLVKHVIPKQLVDAMVSTGTEEEKSWAVATIIVLDYFARHRRLYSKDGGAVVVIEWIGQAIVSESARDAMRAVIQRLRVLVSQHLLRLAKCTVQCPHCNFKCRGDAFVVHVALLCFEDRMAELLLPSFVTDETRCLEAVEAAFAGQAASRSFAVMTATIRLQDFGVVGVAAEDDAVAAPPTWTLPLASFMERSPAGAVALVELPGSDAVAVDWFVWQGGVGSKVCPHCGAATFSTDDALLAHLGKVLGTPPLPLPVVAALRRLTKPWYLPAPWKRERTLLAVWAAPRGSTGEQPTPHPTMAVDVPPTKHALPEILATADALLQQLAANAAGTHVAAPRPQRHLSLEPCPAAPLPPLPSSAPTAAAMGVVVDVTLGLGAPMAAPPWMPGGGRLGSPAGCLVRVRKEDPHLRHWLMYQNRRCGDAHVCPHCRTVYRTRADLAVHLGRVFGAPDFKIDTASAAFVSAAPAVWFLPIPAASHVSSATQGNEPPPPPRWSFAAWLP
jgi:hypothetical protein